MPSLFGVDIVGEVFAAMGDGLLPATLIEVVEGTRVSGQLSAGKSKQSINHGARGFIEDYQDKDFQNSLIQVGDRKITLLGANIPTPKIADRILIENKTYTVVNVKRDPAAATYECQSRG